MRVMATNLHLFPATQSSCSSLQAALPFLHWKNDQVHCTVGNRKIIMKRKKSSSSKTHKTLWSLLSGTFPDPGLSTGLSWCVGEIKIYESSISSSLGWSGLGLVSCVLPCVVTSDSMVTSRPDSESPTSSVPDVWYSSESLSSVGFCWLVGVLSLSYSRSTMGKSISSLQSSKDFLQSLGLVFEHLRYCETQDAKPESHNNDFTF